MFFLKFQVLIDCQSIEILNFCPIFGNSIEKTEYLFIVCIEKIGYNTPKPNSEKDKMTK